MTAPTIIRVPCPVAGCTYKAENVGSIPAHIAMAHGGSVAQTAPDPDELTCVGSNHVPGCEHLRASASKALVRTTGDARLLEIPLELVDVADNVRVTLVDIDELAASIVELGVLQPVKATLLPDGRYRLLWGQRRVLAARKAGLATIPALVSTEEPDDRPIEQLVENLHRADLNPIDRAQAMRAVVDAGVSQADLARKLGIAPSTVANDLRILEAVPEVVAAVASGEISPAHAKAIVGLSTADQLRLLARAIDNGYSAHSLESDAKYIREREAEMAKAGARRAKIAGHVVDALGKADVPKSAEVRISVPYNVEQSSVIAAAVEAGWTNTRSGWGRKTKDCGCSAFVVEVSDYKGAPDVRPTCISDEHQAAATAQAEAERVAKHQRETEEREQLEAALQASVAVIPLTLARLLLRWFDNYGGSTWTEYQAIAAAELTERIARRIANTNGAKPIPVGKVIAALAGEAEAS